MHAQLPDIAMSTHASLRNDEQRLAVGQGGEWRMNDERRNGPRKTCGGMERTRISLASSTHINAAVEAARAGSTSRLSDLSHLRDMIAMVSSAGCDCDGFPCFFSPAGMPRAKWAQGCSQ